MSQKKKSLLESAPSVELPDKKKINSGMETLPQREIAEPNEAFFGTLLIGCLALSLIALVGYFGFSGYRYFRTMNAEKAIPSIAGLPAAETKETRAVPSEETAKKEEPASALESSTVDKKTLDIKVLNGGAAKGVAGAYVEKLKKEGFTKTVVGNSFGNYTGATLYAAKGQEANADFLKETVIKDYPALVNKSAEPGNKDTTAAALVLILGR